MSSFACLPFIRYLFLPRFSLIHYNIFLHRLYPRLRSSHPLVLSSLSSLIASTVGAPCSALAGGNFEAPLESSPTPLVLRPPSLSHPSITPHPAGHSREPAYLVLLKFTSALTALFVRLPTVACPSERRLGDYERVRAPPCVLPFSNRFVPDLTPSSMR